MSTRCLDSQVPTKHPFSFSSRDLLTSPPRPETEAYTTHLAELLISGKLDKYLFKPAPENPQGRSFTRTKQLRILDVCSGSGCISLLLHSLLLKSGKFPNIRTLGLDISPQAVALANENLARNIKQGHFPSPKIRNEVDVRQQDEGLKDAFFGRENRLRGKKLEQKKARNAHLAFFSGDRAMHFAEHDIFTPLSRSLGTYSIIISNPPYISSSSFARETTRSVRLYEPKLALVPDPEKYPSLSKKKTRKQSPAIQPSHPDTPPSPSPPSNKHKPHPADIFHQHLLRLSTLCSAKILLMEVGSTTQALRVLHLALSTPRPHNGKPIRYELWRDFPAQEPREGEETEVVVGKKVVPVRGAGRICAVVLVRVPFAVAAEEKQEERNARRTQ
jgi:methylase of polypeptide subunit release factors